MSRSTFSITLLSKEPEGGSHVLPHPLALLMRIGESWNPTEFQSSATITARNGLEFGIARRGSALAYQDRGTIGLSGCLSGG